jgi:hypothetical protein
MTETSTRTSQLVIINGRYLIPAELEAKVEFGGWEVGKNSKQVGEELSIDSVALVASHYLGGVEVEEELFQGDKINREGYNLVNSQKQAILSEIADRARKIAAELKAPYFGLVITRGNKLERKTIRTSLKLADLPDYSELMLSPLVKNQEYFTKEDLGFRRVKELRPLVKMETKAEYVLHPTAQIYVRK